MATYPKVSWSNVVKQSAGRGHAASPIKGPQFSTVPPTQPPAIQPTQAPSAEPSQRDLDDWGCAPLNDWGDVQYALDPSPPVADEPSVWDREWEPSWYDLSHLIIPYWRQGVMDALDGGVPGTMAALYDRVEREQLDPLWTTWSVFNGERERRPEEKAAETARWEADAQDANVGGWGWGAEEGWSVPPEGDEEEAVKAEGGWVTYAARPAYRDSPNQPPANHSDKTPPEEGAGWQQVSRKRNHCRGGAIKMPDRKGGEQEWRQHDRR